MIPVVHYCVGVCCTLVARVGVMHHGAAAPRCLRLRFERDVTLVCVSTRRGPG